MCELLVSRRRCSALALLRRAGTQDAERCADIWAPALQRTANGRCCASPEKRCAASGARDLSLVQLFQLRAQRAAWIASSQGLLAMTQCEVATDEGVSSQCRLAPQAAESSILLGPVGPAERPRRSAALAPMLDIEPLHARDDAAGERRNTGRRLFDDEQDRRDTAEHADQE